METVTYETYYRIGLPAIRLAARVLPGPVVSRMAGRGARREREASGYRHDPEDIRGVDRYDRVSDAAATWQREATDRGLAWKP